MHASDIVGSNVKRLDMSSDSSVVIPPVGFHVNVSALFSDRAVAGQSPTTLIFLDILYPELLVAVTTAT